MKETDTLIKLRLNLASSAPSTIDQKVAQRSAYNFIYGIALFCFLRDNKVIQVEKQTHLKKIDKIKFLLQYLQEHYPELYCVDLPDYDLDDYTLRFEEEPLLKTAQEVFKLVRKIKYNDFWSTFEEFFIASF